MASTGKSRWGSLLSQAVAGVEARLDTILAENEEQAAAQKTQEPKDSKPSTATSTRPASPSKPSTGASKPASANRTNDRLQERLARAMAAKAAAQNAETSSGRPSLSAQASPRQSLDVSSRASFESARATQNAQDASTPRESTDEARKSIESTSEASALTKELTNGNHEGKSSLDKEAESSGSTPEDAAAPNATEQELPSEPAMSLPDHVAPEPEGADEPEPEGATGLQKALEEAQTQHQEETHGYVERIDALEAKLQFLAREATESARKAVLAAPAGSAEKKLAEKDQQITQLMEEGKNLASTEQKHRTIMKKLRAKLTDEEKEITSLKAAKERTDREMESTRSKARRADELEKARVDLQKKVDNAQRELTLLKPEVESKNSTIANLKSQLQKATEQADAMTAKANDQAREQDRKKIADLEESVAALQVEKNLVADRAKIQEHDLREKAERANERLRALELEMKAEVQIMESKLEGMRIRAEEASSGVTGDSQAKLLRQVETLQTQYSIASENWQGIESTLLARITNLEKERDEALQRESDMRKKAREAAVRAKRQEEELEETKSRLPNIEQDVKSYRTQLDLLKKRAEQAEAALSESRADFDKQRQVWKEEKEEKQSRPPTERRSWLEDLPISSFKSDSRPASPLLQAPQRTFSSDFLGIQSLPGKGRKASAPSSTSDAGGNGSVRRPSAQPSSQRPSIFSPTATSMSGAFSPAVESVQTPSIHPFERDDLFESPETPASPRQILQDMVSVSTVAAGPSVQLVERMSAAIRRLESEKVAGREELTRISSQRDEARAEIVALMRSVEGGKAATERLKSLETEIAVVNARYETTLEMLGEKSEMVEELRADVQDVKDMYRELVERTVK